MKEGEVAWPNGIDQRFDKHMYVETAIMNIVDPNWLLSFKYMENLWCYNFECRHLTKVKNYNEMYWTGSSPDLLTPIQSSKPSQKCKLVCKHCRIIPSCIVLCSYRMYYIVFKDPKMTKACVHIGMHKHLVAKGHCRDAIVQICEKVKHQVAKTPNATLSAISLALRKEILMQGLIDDDVKGSLFFEDELSSIFKKWSKLVVYE